MEVMLLADRFCEAMDEAYEPVFAAARDKIEQRNAEREAASKRYEEEREKLREQRRKEREAVAARQQEQYELIRWYVGHKFRLKRDGYRATVFGTIDKVTPSHIYSTSEKGVSMQIEIAGVNWFEVKNEPTDKRYDTIIDRRAQPAKETA